METNNNQISENPESETPEAPTIPTESTESLKPVPQSEPKSTKSSKPLIWCLAILATISIVAAVVFAYLYFTATTQSPNPNSNNNQSSTAAGDSTASEETSDYILADYVSLSEISVPITFPEEIEKGHTQDTITKIELTNLPQTIIARFNEAQEELINYDVYTMRRSNDSGASINDNILSVYTIYEYNGVYGDFWNAISLNYDLNTKQELSNNELSTTYNVTGKKIYDTILNQLVNSVTTESFFLDTQGGVSGSTISLKDFTEKLQDYEKALEGRLDIIKMYVDNNKLHVLYKQSEILEALGMSTNMGSGLLPEIQDISF